MNALLSIFWDSQRPTKLLTILLYLLAAVGFSLANTVSQDLWLIFQIASRGAWVTLSALLFFCRIVGLFLWEGTWHLRWVTPVLGIILWSLLFSASVLAPQFSMGILYLVAALLEMWILARVFAEKPSNHE